LARFWPCCGRLPGRANISQTVQRIGLAAAFLLGSIGAAGAQRVHGLAMHGEPKHPAGFTAFPYVNAEAPHGGRLVLGVQGTFDSLNPFIIRGVSASGMRDYVFESLLTRSADEPFSLYGLVAETMEVPANRSSITFHLNPRAKFADGKAIRPEDVLYSFDLLRQKGWPYHRSHYGKVAKAEKIGEGSVRFTFAVAGDREAALLLGLMPILPQHALTPEAFEQTTLTPPLGSGPYTVDRMEAGRSIVYRRNPSWWARDLPATRGRFNFDEIRVEYFRDVSALFEAFKAGEIDIRLEDDPNRWLNGYGFAAVRDGTVIKRELATQVPSGMSSIVLNARRTDLADARVRRALLHMFDAEWINRSLYNGLYKRTQSYFDRSELSSHGRPADARELRLLSPFAKLVKPSVLDGTYGLPVTDGQGDNREQLRIASKLLAEAGYSPKGGKQTKAGKPLRLEFLAQTRPQERLMLTYARTLARLGIDLSVRHVDSAQFNARLKSFDFDMLIWNWTASLSPGNEQVNRWGSAAAVSEGSLNLTGTQNPAADAMLEALLNADATADFTSAVRAFDRVLISGDYVIPLFHLPTVWVAHWSHLRFPETLPLSGYEIDTWWTVRR
jgi:peptide/nickel transport system substrate-binding protein